MRVIRCDICRKVIKDSDQAARTEFLTSSFMWTGSRMVRDLSARARVIA